MASDGFPSCVLNFLGIFSESHLSAVHSSSESLIGTSMLAQSCCCHVIGLRFREISDVSGSSSRGNPRKGVFVTRGRQKKNKDGRKKHWLFPPAANGANWRVHSSFHHRSHGRPAGSCGAVRGNSSQTPSTAQAHARHTQRPIHHDRNPTHGGSDGLLSNVAVGRRWQPTLHSCLRSERSVTSSPSGVR